MGVKLYLRLLIDCECYKGLVEFDPTIVLTASASYASSSIGCYE